MRQKWQANWLLGMGVCLLAIALSLTLWLASMSVRANIPPSPESPLDLIGLLDVPADEDGFVKVDWDHWKSINPDLIAWVNVEGTRINYPIMRAPADDPSFYLHHDIYRNYSIYGVPYLDHAAAEEANSPLPAFNAIIYGHHMNDGSMFSDFAEYSDEAFAQDHMMICLQTPAGKQRLKVAFVAIVDGDTTSKSVCFEDKDAFETWFFEQRDQAVVVLDEMNSIIEGDESSTVSEDASERNEEPSAPSCAPPYTVTFCTCSYHRFDNERTLVVCIPEE